MALLGTMMLAYRQAICTSLWEGSIPRTMDSLPILAMLSNSLIGGEGETMRVSKMIQAVDTHVCGEPGRVIVGGVLDVPGSTMFEKMRYLETEADDLRLRMLREPRGYPATCCNLILPPTHPDADR